MSIVRSIETQGAVLPEERPDENTAALLDALPSRQGGGTMRRCMPATRPEFRDWCCFSAGT
jgi:hypothetical protein